LLTQLFAKKLYYLIPYAILQTGIKWLGYRVGFYGHNLPISLKKKLSGQPYYWTSKYFSKNL
jgi:rhamnosyltransferase